MIELAKKYRIVIVGLVLGIVAVVMYIAIGMPQGELTAGELQQEPLVYAQYFERDGYLLTGHPQLKEGVWYLVHSQNGEDAKAAELLFDENSLCASATASGVCRPDLFKNERTAHVAGEWVGEQLLVVELTFTAPVR